MPMIEMQDVSKWYGDFQVLDKCTTSVEKGEVVGEGAPDLMLANKTIVSD